MEWKAEPSARKIKSLRQTGRRGAPARGAARRAVVVLGGPAGVAALLLARMTAVTHARGVRMVGYYYSTACGGRSSSCAVQATCLSELAVRRLLQNCESSRW